MKQFKRILAILAVVIIVGLYLATLVCAIFIKRLSGQMFLACIVATVMVPLVLYLLFWLYDLLQSRTDSEADREEKTRQGFADAAAFNQGKKIVGEDGAEAAQEDGGVETEEDGAEAAQEDDCVETEEDGAEAAQEDDGVETEEDGKGGTNGRDGTGEE